MEGEDLPSLVLSALPFVFIPSNRLLSQRPRIPFINFIAQWQLFDIVHHGSQIPWQVW